MTREKSRRPLELRLNPDSLRGARRRLFGGLLCLTGLVCSGLLLAVNAVAQPGLARLHPWLAETAQWLVWLVIAGLVIFPCLHLLLQLSARKPLPLSKTARRLVYRFFLPLMELLGRVCRIPKERVRQAFVYSNNQLVRAENRVYRPEDILVLAPHCLQNHRCAIRLTHNLNNCRACGRCAVAELKRLGDTYGVFIALATGGSLARRLVLERRPQCLVAVACERDLTSGIQDVAPLPVLGVFNTRPFGPCIDTDVAIPEVEAALRRLLGLRDLGDERDKERFHEA